MIDNRKYSIVHIIKICFLVVGWWWIILNLKRKESQHGTVSRACSWLNSSSSSSIWLLLRYGRDGNPVVERNNYRHDALIYSPYCIVCYVRQKAFVFPAAWITDLGIYVHDAQVPIPPEGKMERGGRGNSLGRRDASRRCWTWQQSAGCWTLAKKRRKREKATSLYLASLFIS